MPYPSTPFDSTITSGAQAYSRPEELKKYHLGNAPTGPCTVDALSAGFARINAPLWNGKPFWVKLGFIPNPGQPDPEPPPDPDPEPPPDNIDYITIATFYTNGAPPTTETFIPLESGEP